MIYTHQEKQKNFVIHKSNCCYLYSYKPVLGCLHQILVYLQEDCELHYTMLAPFSGTYSVLSCFKWGSVVSFLGFKASILTVII